MKKIVIVDYGLGNLYSIAQACIHLGYNPVISGDNEDILNADYVILPGVGAFSVAMHALRDTGLAQTIKKYAATGKPLMGVCLGMQLLFETSEEFGENKGLALIKGRVLRFPSIFEGSKLRIPNIGWCKIYSSHYNEWTNTPLCELKPSKDHMYFIHSYYVEPESKKNTLALSNYNGFKYASAVVNNNIWGFQFHPEKSGEEGLSIYKNFLEI